MLNFLALLDGGSPLPPGPEYIPGPLEAFVAFMLGYLLFVANVLFVLPRRWTRWAFPEREGKEGE